MVVIPTAEASASRLGAPTEERAGGPHLGAKVEKPKKRLTISRSPYGKCCTRCIKLKQLQQRQPPQKLKCQYADKPPSRREV